MSLKNNKF